MFQDEAGFGRINTPKYCWTGGTRPNVPCHHIREYRYAFGAPLERFFSQSEHFGYMRHDA